MQDSRLTPSQLHHLRLRARIISRSRRFRPQLGLLLGVVDPQPRPRYTLDELLAQCDASAELTDEDRAWIGDAPMGDELI